MTKERLIYISRNCLQPETLRLRVYETGVVSSDVRGCLKHLWGGGGARHPPLAWLALNFVAPAWPAMRMCLSWSLHLWARFGGSFCASADSTSSQLRVSDINRSGALLFALLESMYSSCKPLDALHPFCTYNKTSSSRLMARENFCAEIPRRKGILPGKRHPA